MHRGFDEAAWIGAEPPVVDVRDRATVAPEGLEEDVAGEAVTLLELVNAGEALAAVEPPSWMDAAASLISISFEGLEETRVEGEVDGLELWEIEAAMRWEAELDAQAELETRAERAAFRGRRLPGWSATDARSIVRALEDGGADEDDGVDGEWAFARLDRDGNVLSEDSDDGVGGDDWDDGHPDQDDLAPEGLGSGELDWDSHDYESGYDY